MTDQLVFKALQTYSDGDTVRWIDDPAPGTEPEHPAPVLTLAPAGTPPTAPPAPAAPIADGESNDTDPPYALAGILLALTALVTALLAYRRTPRTPEPPNPLTNQRDDLALVVAHKSG